MALQSLAIWEAGTLFPDSVLKHVEDDIAHYESKGQSTSLIARVGTILMNVLTESRIRGQTSCLGRPSATKDRTGKARVDLQTTHPDPPRASGLINEITV